mmetsp:Transcript_11776/g.38749  ORF Transcript_11776/g.38749 Transcript_11776/m.38749 type:complete len:209 (+) Transcript_11776:109-735(+)
MGAGIVERLIQGSLFFVALASALSTPVRVARCWKEASELLKSSPAVVVKNALSPEAQDAWRAASCGDVRVTDIRQGLAELFHEEPPEVVVKEAEGVAASFATHFLDGDDVRFRASVADCCHSPCPKIHTDNVEVRCLLAANGPGTIVVDRVQLPFDDSLPDGAFYQAKAGDALLLKGSKRGAPGARHRSPRPTEERRVLLVFDCLSDV